MDEAAKESRSRFGWPRVSLRTGLLFVALVAVALGFIVKLERTRRAGEERIKPFGGSVAWKERGPRWLTRLVGRDVFAIPWEVSFLNEPLQDDDLLALSGLEETRQLIISQNATFTGTGLRHLEDMQNLERLYIYDVPITDDGLANLPKIASLEKIEAYATRITDKVIPFIEEFDFVDEIQLGSASLSKLKVQELDERMPRTTVGWSGQGYSGD